MEIITSPLALVILFVFSLVVGGVIGVWKGKHKPQPNPEQTPHQ